jgi:hypothetical protein
MVATETITRVVLSRWVNTPKLVTVDRFSASRWCGYQTMGHHIPLTDEDAIAEARKLWPEAKIEVEHHTSGEYAHCPPQGPIENHDYWDGRVQWGNKYWNRF